MSYIGNTKIGKMYLGNTGIAKAYLGNTLVFQKGGSPTPPQPQPILPAGFTELAYVATNSNAYIDTGVAGATDLEITTKFYVGSYVQYASVYGNYIDSNYNYNRVILGSETSLLAAGGLNQSQSVSGFSLSAVHTLVVNSTTAILDGNSTSITAAAKTANTKNICLGNRNTDNPVERNIGLRIYSFKINKDGTTVLNLVPAMRDSDDAVGFYDLVSESFVKSLTGTEFTAGPANNYAPVEYIVTDGSCYILPGSGFAATPPKSSEIKVMCGSDENYGLLCGWTNASGSNSNNFALAKVYYGKKVGITHFYNYGPNDGIPSIEYSVDNQTPFIVKTDIMKGSQHISVKQENSESWTTVSKTDNNTVSSTYQFAILNGYYNNSYSIPAPSGTRLYYCKIYSDNTYGGLVFDGVACYCNGEYGLWDKVSGTFKGSAASGHSFSGPSNS